MAASVPWIVEPAVAGQGVALAQHSEIPVDPGAQVGEDAHRAALVADVAVRRRHHDADDRLVGELLAGTAHRVAGERLDRLRRLQRPAPRRWLPLPPSAH